MKICRVATVPFVFNHHLKSQIEAMVDAGHNVHIVTSPSSGFGGSDYDRVNISGVTCITIQIPRSISIFRDIKALIQLYKLFKRENYDVVHSVTSKAGLLCSIAAMASGVPIRMHSYVGQPWLSQANVIRILAKKSDWLIARLNTQCYADSFSQREFLISESVVKPSHVRVLGSGSIAGVDLERFSKNKYKDSNLRNDLSIPVDSIVITFIGRLTREKGVCELISAYREILQSCKLEIYLLMVGPADDLILESELRKLAKACSTLKLIGYAEHPECYLAITDIFCLPSYREGFATAVIEAAAMGVPSVATEVTGLVDSVVQGVTGFLVPSKNVSALKEGLFRLIEDPLLREQMGLSAMERVHQKFSANYVNELMLQEYNSLITFKNKNYDVYSGK